MGERSRRGGGDCIRCIIAHRRRESPFPLPPQQSVGGTASPFLPGTPLFPTFKDGKQKPRMRARKRGTKGSPVTVPPPPFVLSIRGCHCHWREEEEENDITRRSRLRNSFLTPRCDPPAADGRPTDRQGEKGISPLCLHTTFFRVRRSRQVLERYARLSVEGYEIDRHE